MISLIPEDSQQRLNEFFGDEFQNFNKIEVQALVTADLENSIDNTRMRQLSGNHATDVTRILQGLVAKGALMQEGKTRGARYKLPELIDSVYKSSDSLYKDADSLHKGINSPSDSLYKDADSLHKPNSTEHDALRKIASPAQTNKRLPPKEMEQLIKRLCDGRWLSRRQISELVDRNMEGLRTRFLAPMVDHGILQLRYPDKPNRVDQAYTLAKNDT